MPVVTVAAPLVREITEWDDYVGRFEASRSVEVRPRVSGELTGIHFTDGQIVRKGQLLSTIDPRPFNAALAEARADAASARSKLALTRTNFARAERLIVDDAISQSDVDQLSAEVRAARSEEHTSELQSLMRISYAVFCLKKKNESQDPSYQSIIPAIR